MEKFNFKRFWKVLKYELSQFCQSYSTAIVIVSIIFAIICMVGYLFKQPMIIGLCSIFIIILQTNLSLFRQGPRVVIPKSFDKCRVMNFLLFPGTVAEKFFAKLLLYLILPYLLCMALICLCPLSPDELAKNVTVSPLALKWKMCGGMFCFSLLISSLSLLGGNLATMKERIIAILVFAIFMALSMMLPEPEWFHNISAILNTGRRDVVTMSEWVFVAIMLVLSSSVAFYKRKCLTINS